MSRPWFVGLLSLILSLTFITIVGCSKAKPRSRDAKQQSPGPNKRVMVLPFVDNSGLGKGTADKITSRFIELLGKSPNLMMKDPPKNMALPADLSSPQYGIVTPPSLIKKAEALGMDALIMGVLDPVSGTTKKRGIWPFRVTRRIYEVSAMINVVHVPSRTVLLTQLETEKVSLPLKKPIDEKALAGQALGEALPDIVKPLASAAAKSLSKDLSQRLRHQK